MLLSGSNIYLLVEDDDDDDDVDEDNEDDGDADYVPVNTSNTDFLNHFTAEGVPNKRLKIV